MKARYIALLVAGLASTVMLKISAQIPQKEVPDGGVTNPPSEVEPGVPAISPLSLGNPADTLEALPQNPSNLSQPAEITLPTTPAEAEALNNILYSEPQSSDEPVAEPFRTKWSVRPRVCVSVMYDNNILLSPGSKLSDIVFTLTPGIAVGRGDIDNRKENYLLLDYAPSAVVYADHSGRDAVNHEANLGIQTQAGCYTFALKARFLDITGPNTDIGKFTTWQVYDTDFLTTYDISERNFAELDLQNHVMNYRDGLDSTEWTVRGWWNYRYFSKATLGAGLSVGQLDVQDSDPQTYLQPLLKTSYAASEKVSVEGSGGVDIRRFGSGAGERVNPVWTIGAVYTPMDATTVRVDTYRLIEGAASIIGTDYTVTGIRVQASHTILQRYELSLAGGYERSDYNNITSLPTVERHDNCVFVRPAIVATLSRNFSVSVFWKYRRNVSSPDCYGFEDVQAGVSLGYSY